MHVNVLKMSRTGEQMNSQLTQIKDILSEFLGQMKKKEELWESLGSSIAGTSGFGDERVEDSWPRKEACCWIFVDLYDHFPKFDRTPPTVEAAKEFAAPYYDDGLSLTVTSKITQNALSRDLTLMKL
jgi:hypothetical protein